MAIDTDDNDLVDAEACEKYLAQLRELEAYRAYRTTAAIDWFFDQATRAIHGELWLAACTTFLNGIETSLRVTMKLKASQAQPQAPTPLVDLSDMATLSNALLRRAHQAGMPVTLLAFPDEQDLLTKIADGAPKLPYAEIVRVRHNLCHGNILEHIITVSDGMGEPVRLFTPECMRDLAQTLSAVSKVWIAGLHQYWCDNNLSMP
ncbi:MULTISPECIES: hypothetical protein [Enterobacteriaceae]|uniref:Uncharacterized protein n=8 Tax=Salmonella enterica I TaxID=59201 RepID=A0A719P931_SALTS|nr:hypothetical protein [Salmonella enterica]EBP3328628.1 hypothetical protein [Salmonella enterica subsp. enterica]EBW6697271.1 hypothetical protein [Salmonella enterica subsp. enterica serovar Typhimurium]EHQ9219556.1 hypothetical protein [Salmonella enterica subsp. enterica serovar Rough:-]CAM91627.1 hypothetical protein SPAP0287 [Salmonella enterica subsp. enterica serovar Paratyphi A str. AKU_12601]CDU50814.1 hypothetical protein PA136_4329 [Salmonella enterica subsp. enterica serovar Par